MKTVSAGMETMVASPAQTLAWAITLTRRDGQVFRYCSSTRDKTIEGNLYIANPGFTVSNITCSAGPGVVDTLELIFLPSSDFAKADFWAGRWHGTRVEFNQFNWAAPADGFLPWPTYRVSDVESVVGGFKLQLRDLRVLWGQDYTLLTSKSCQNRLGDARCTKDLTAFTYAFEVTAVTSARTVFTIDLTGLAADWFTEGQVIFDDGLHADLSLLVRDHATGGIITLAVPLITDIVVGQTGTIIAGCLKRREDCRDKFDNILNMRAPGLDAQTLEETVGA
jgi:uncharacterized phage protein (TIGR02218 family)